MIGRDLVRLLQDVARLPEFREFWKDLLSKPQALAPNFGGINQLLAIRTPRIYIQSRVTPEIESQLMVSDASLCSNSLVFDEECKDGNAKTIPSVVCKQIPCYA